MVLPVKEGGPSRLVLEKNLLDLVYMHPGGVRTAMALFFLQSVI